MGPADSLPLPPATPTLGGRAWRIVRIGLLGVAALLVVAVAGALWVLTHLDHRWVKPSVVRAARDAGLAIEYRSLDLSLGSGRLHGTGFRIAQPPRFAGRSDNIGPFVAVHDLELSVGVSELLSGRIRISKLELHGLEVNYAADETANTISLLFPDDGTDPAATTPSPPLSHALERAGGLGLQVAQIRIPDAALGYIEFVQGRIERRVRATGLQLQAGLREQSGQLDADLRLWPAARPEGARLHFAQRARPASSDGTVPGRDAIDATARLALDGSIAVRELLRVKLALGIEDAAGLPPLAGLPLDATLELSIGFEPGRGRTRIELKKLALFGSVLTASLAGTLEDGAPDTLRELSGRANLAADELPFQPEGLDLKNARAQLLLDRAQLSPEGALGRVELDASLERAAFVTPAGARMACDGLTLGASTDASIALTGTAGAASAGAGAADRSGLLRVALAARHISVLQPASASEPESTVKGSDLAVTLGTSPATGPTAGAAQPDALSVRFANLELTQGRGTSAELRAPVLRASGANLLRSLATNAPASGTIGLEVARVQARADDAALELAPVSMALQLAAFRRSGAGLFGLGGDARLELSAAGSAKSGARTAKLTGFAPVVSAAFDRAELTGSLPIATLRVREAGQRLLWVERADLRVSVADPPSLAPPLARGRGALEGAVGRLEVSGNAMALPVLAFSTRGDGAAYVIEGRASIDHLRTASGRSAGTHRFELAGRADLQRHVVDLDAHLRPPDATRRGPLMDASAHAAIDGESGALDNRFAFDAHRLAPALAMFLPKGASADFNRLHVAGKGRWQGLFQRPVAAGALPRLASDAWSRSSGQQELEVRIEELSFAQAGARRIGAPRIELGLAVARRQRAASAEFHARAASMVVQSGGHELTLTELRPKFSLQVSDVEHPQVASVVADIGLARLEQDYAPGYPVSDVRLTATLDAAPGRIVLREFSLAEGAGHASLQLAGAYESVVGERAGQRAARPEAPIDGREAFSVSGELKQDLATLAATGFASRASGAVRVPFVVQSGDLRSFRAAARLVAEAVDFRSADGSLVIEALNGEIPIEQTATLLQSGLVLEAGSASDALSRARFPDVQPFLNSEAFVTADAIAWRGQTFGPLAGNIRIAGTTFSLDRLQLGYRGGSLTGQLEADLKPGASLLTFRGNATGIHTARGGQDVLDANLTLRFVPQSLALDGTAQLVRVSKAHIRELLDALDPYHADTQLNKVRSLLSLGYPRFARLTASEGLLDFEISLGGLASAVSIDAIRAIPIAPLLDVYAADTVDVFFPRARARARLDARAKAKEGNPP
jgi:hypothetical protein